MSFTLTRPAITGGLLNRNCRQSATLLFVLALTLAACRPIPDLPESGKTARPAPGEASTAGGHSTTFDASKYEWIYVYTLEEIDNDARSLLHVSYPVTENDAINTRMKDVSQQFIDEYRAAAAEIEEAYQEYKEESGMEAATFVAHYRQSFDVSVANRNLVFFDLERSIHTGGTGNSFVIGFIFDRRSGVELAIPDLFVDGSYLKRLSELSRMALAKRVRDESLLSDMDWVEEGTAPTEENFDNILFRDDGSVVIMFDKYQVAAGAEGVVEVIAPVEAISDLLEPEIQELLGLNENEGRNNANSGSFAEQTDLQSRSITAAIPLLHGVAWARMNSAPGTPVAARNLSELDWAGVFQEDAPADQDIDCLEVACVALTFDDGPSVYTEGLLDILKEQGVRATFFILGKSARIQSETVSRMFAEGHQIGNHTWNHPNLTQLSDELIRQQIQQTDEIVTQIIGQPTQHLRPPYGAFNDRVLAVSGMPVIFWSVDPLDWKDRDADIVAARIIESPAGAIILAHDIHRSTVAAVPAIIEALRERGIHFVTVTQLFEPQPLLPGTVYTRQPAMPPE